jgi:iron complex outermembrane receptor protein
MNKHIRTKLLTHTALALAIGSVTGTLQAQDTGDQVVAEEEALIEEVVVTGIRASLEDALGLKRNSDQIMDAISAEDIGKFPDENIGEALQRIPGISLDREAGEGKGVSIRGLGAGLSQVTVNGQNIASTEGSREFNYSVLDASMVSALEVWKSPMASQTEGAVGGTVNIRTRGPLDFKTTKFNLSMTGQYEDLTDDWGDKYVVSFITQNDDQTFGISLDYNYSDRLTRSDQVIIPGWTGVDETHRDYTSRGWDDLLAENGLDYLYFPMDASSRVRVYDRQREGYNGAISWRPTDNVEINLRAFTSLLDDYDTNNTAQVRIRDLVIGGGRNVNNYEWEFDGNDVVFFDATDANIGGGWRAYRNIATLRQNEWQSNGGGMDFDWQLTDTANLYFAFGGSSGSGDKETYPVVDFRDAIGFSVDLRDNPRYPQSVIVGGGTDDSVMDMWTVSVNNQYDKIDSDYVQLDFSNDVSWGHVSRFLAGVRFNEDSTRHTQVRHTNNRQGTAGFTLADFARVTGDGENYVVPGFTYANNTLAPLNGSFTQVDLRAVLNEFPYDTRPTATRYDESYKVAEETIAAYFQFDLDGEMFGIPYRGNFGVRYYETDLVSSGWLDRNGELAGKVERSYSDWLPSLNLTMVLQEDLLLRFGAASVMARPDQDDLALAGTYNLTEETARVGNPFLEPFEADTFDISLEWYLNDAGMLQGGFFYKDIDSFISNGQIPGGVPVDIGDGEFVIFDATGPINGDGGTVKGFEAAYQQVFTFLPGFWSGFGTQINYTYTDSDVSIPYFEGGLTYSMPLEGLSKNSMNFVLFWENDVFSARAAYNYRDSFLSNRSNTQGNPVFTDDYGQLDMSINWNISKNFSLSLNGINLNEEARYQYFLTPDRMLAHRASGKRYSVTLRAKF